MEADIKKALTRIARVKDKSGVKFQTEIELFKIELRKNKELSWSTLNFQKTSMEIYKALGEVISEGQISEFVYFNYNLPDPLTVLAHFIQKSKLTKLHLEGSKYGIAFPPDFFFLPVTLKDLSLNGLSDQNRQGVLKSLGQLKLNSLTIKDSELRNTLTNESVNLLLQVIQNHPLKKLTLHGVLNLSIFELLVSFIETSEITTLNLSISSSVDANKICQLLGTLCTKSKITELGLFCMFNRSEVFKNFVENLPNTRLTRISLDCCCSQISDIENLANVLANTQLQYLSFRNNLDFDGARLLAKKLMGSHLTQISDEGIKKTAYAILAPALANNKERHLTKHALMKTTLDPYLPRVTTDLIEEYLTGNPELIATESIAVLEERSIPMLKKYQQLSEEPAENKNKIKRRKIR